MVELILENEQDKEELTTEIEKAIKDVCVAVMEEEECDFDAEISVTLVDNDTIRSINKEQRDIDEQRMFCHSQCWNLMRTEYRTMSTIWTVSL